MGKPSFYVHTNGKPLHPGTMTENLGRNTFTILYFQMTYVLVPFYVIVTQTEGLVSRASPARDSQSQQKPEELSPSKLERYCVVELVAEGNLIDTFERYNFVIAFASSIASPSPSFPPVSLVFLQPI